MYKFLGEVEYTTDTFIGWVSYSHKDHHSYNLYFCNIL
jgi:hypothetical protein